MKKNRILSPLPPLLVDLQVNSVSRNELFGKEDQTPEVLRQGDSSYDFVVQAKINPEYYFICWNSASWNRKNKLLRFSFYGL